MLVSGRNIKMLYGGNRNTICLDLAGEGCEQIGTALGFQTVEDWQRFLSKLSRAGAKFTRVDWAFDDRTGALDLNIMRDAVTMRHCRTRFHSGSQKNYVDPRSGRDCGEELTFGSRKSSVYVRIYDKAKERYRRQSSVAPDHWVRVEVESRDAMAEELTHAFIRHGSRAISLDLLARIKFIDPTSDSNKKRWPVSAWWTEFLSATVGTRIAEPKQERSLADAAAALELQWGPYLSLLMSTEGFGQDWLDGVVDRGSKRLQEKHLEVVQRWHSAD